MPYYHVSALSIASILLDGTDHMQQYHCLRILCSHVTPSRWLAGLLRAVNRGWRHRRLWVLDCCTVPLRYVAGLLGPLCKERRHPRLCILDGRIAPLSGVPSVFGAVVRERKYDCPWMLPRRIWPSRIIATSAVQYVFVALVSEGLYRVGLEVSVKAPSGSDVCS